MMPICGRHTSSGALTIRPGSTKASCTQPRYVRRSNAMADESDTTPRKLISKFWKTLDNPSAPGAKVDMYLLHDDKTGEGIVSVGVPHGDKETASLICNRMNDKSE